MKSATEIKKSKTKKAIKYRDLVHRYRLLLDLMDQVPDVIYFKDREGRLIMVNQAHARGLGLKPEEVAGKTDFDIFPKDRAEKMFKDDMHVMKTGKPIIDKIERATRADGVDNYVSTTKIPRYDDKGRIIGLVGITRDITQRMQFEHLRDEKEGIVKKLEALEDLNKMESEFVSMVSHELRTPLAIIKEAIALIFDKIAGPINDKQEELLTKAKNNIERLKNIIDGLLDISRMEGRRLRLHYSLVNLNDLILDSSEFFKKLVQEKGIYLNYHLPAEQINIFIDAERINRVISNLLNNAVKFTEKNGRIDLEVKTLEDKVRIGVIDTGIGIAKEDMPRLFNKFVQVSKKTGLERQGLGLGLSIAKELVGYHGGEIWAESRLGVGSKFYFTLPRFYTTNVLDKNTRDKINNFLDKGITLYLINLLILNLEQFRKRIKIEAGRLLEDLRSIIEKSLGEVSQSGRERAQIVIEDYKIGEYSIIFPEATERQAARLCELLRNKINDYVRENKIENVFINLGVLSYPSQGPLITTQQFLTNLYLKKIYIGSEIRHFKRIRYKLNIEILLPKDKSHVSVAIDISQGGICFISKEPLLTDSRIEMKLSFPGKYKTLYAKGRVAWIKSIENSPKGSLHKYKVGVEFIQLSSKTKKTISQFIRSVS